MPCLSPWLTLVQDPPRTGKTQVENALVRAFIMERSELVLATATSNTATDNLALRLMNTGVAVRRVGPSEKIGNDLHDISMYPLCLRERGPVTRTKAQNAGENNRKSKCTKKRKQCAQRP